MRSPARFVRGFPGAGFAGCRTPMKAALVLLLCVSVGAWSDAPTLMRAARSLHASPAVGLLVSRVRAARMSGEDDPSDAAARKQALRLPDPMPPDADAADDWESPSSRSSEPDLFIPILTVGSIAGFSLIVLNEYVTRGFCPPFLSTCINLQESGGWGT